MGSWPGTRAALWVRYDFGRLKADALSQHGQYVSQKHHRKDELLAIPVASRPGWLAVEKGRLEVGGHSLALVRETDVVEIPPAAFAALLLEPGASITYQALLCAYTKKSPLGVHLRIFGTMPNRSVIEVDGIQLISKNNQKDK